jgi:UDP-sugar pyrophosphorylase
MICIVLLNSKLPTEQGKKALEANSSILSSAERATADLLVSLDQAHLFAHWPAAGTEDANKHKFLAQVADIEHAYIGGIKQYVARAKQLLQFALSGGNPYDGYKVSEPTDSVRLEKQVDFDHYELIGSQHAHQAAFVIVAGGLGERLGYKGIKLALPSDSVTGKTFIQLYIEYILTLQENARKQKGDTTLIVPLAIMTSDDTDKLTRELLAQNQNYGMSKDQLIIFKQGKVPSLLDNDAHFVLEESDKYSLDTKPHGHGKT